MEHTTPNYVETKNGPVPATREDAAKMFDCFIRSRPGLDPRDYGWGLEGWRNYRNESASITRQLHRAEKALSQFRWRTYDPELFADTMSWAFSGRLRFRVNSKGHLTLDYCTGQYYPTEYRQAAAVCLESYIQVLNRQD